MKLHLSRGNGQYLFNGYESDRVLINHQPYTKSLIISPNTLLTDWDVENFEALTESHFERFLELDPEVVLLGTGATLRFPHPGLFRSLTQKQIGIEFMDSHAAARTYNILMAEDRRVVCGILF